MKTLNILIILLFSSHSIAQSEFGLGFSMTSSNYIGKLSGNNNKERLFLGAGFFFLVNQRFKKSKTSSLVYGIEYSSIRHLFSKSGSASVKAPLLYQFEFNSGKSVSPIARIGINTLIQFSQSIGTTLRQSNEILTTEKRGGLYPMVQLNLGVRFKINYRHSILLLLGMNKGFILNEKLHYMNIISGADYLYENDGSYFDLKVIWGLTKKNKKTAVSDSLSE